MINLELTQECRAEARLFARAVPAGARGRDPAEYVIVRHRPRSDPHRPEDVLKVDCDGMGLAGMMRRIVSGIWRRRGRGRLLSGS